MDGQLTALAIFGLAAGIKVAGSFVAHRLGPQAQEQWESFTNKLRVKTARICLTLTGAGFWGFLTAIAGKYLLQFQFSIELSENELLVLALLIAVGIVLWLYPKTSEFVC